MIDISTGKQFTRRSALKGLAAILASGVAPSVGVAATCGLRRGLAGRMAAIGGEPKTPYLRFNTYGWLYTGVFLTDHCWIETEIRFPVVPTQWSHAFGASEATYSSNGVHLRFTPLSNPGNLLAYGYSFNGVFGYASLQDGWRLMKIGQPDGANRVFVYGSETLTLKGPVKITYLGQIALGGLGKVSGEPVATGHQPFDMRSFTVYDDDGSVVETFRPKRVGEVAGMVDGHGVFHAGNDKNMVVYGED